ncbi:hypothetical protein [Nocardia stercoris]|uniref:Uncharacterized protein n=1 Tax=Nocardia stercoris TaxID=2483361 RepID=A0A3M2L315_9NOCA|nr:hypothetical protein [Nocardia stercoris]RMI32109.1 hypothetical protein EBN03_13910 [Nocardia stercoris]
MSRQVLRLPLPLDVVKPDVFLPHAPIAAGGAATALPEQPADLLGVPYDWQGWTKPLGDFLHDTDTDVNEFVHHGNLVAIEDEWQTALRAVLQHICGCN